MDHLFYSLPYWFHSKNLKFFLSTMLILPPKPLFPAFPSTIIPESAFLLYTFCFYAYWGIIPHIYSLLKFFNECTKNTFIVFGNLKNCFPVAFFQNIILCLFCLSLQFLLAAFYVGVNYYQCCLRLGPWINRL